MGLFTKLFGGADGCREAMRESYEKHVKLAKQSEVDSSNALVSPHAIGLYGALGTRYMSGGLPVMEGDLWAELSPFLAMKESEAVEALAEYAVFQELRRYARQEWLRTHINDALRAPSDNSLVAMAHAGLVNQVAWCDLLSPFTIAAIERAADREGRV